MKSVVPLIMFKTDRYYLLKSGVSFTVMPRVKTTTLSGLRGCTEVLLTPLLFSFSGTGQRAYVMLGVRFS